MSHLVSDACPSQCKALTICHVNRHLSGSPESRLTCETRLPRSPGLACGAARTLQAVTVSHLVSDACPSQCKALIARHACMHPYDKLESKPTCGGPVCPEAPVWPVEPLAPASTHGVSPCVTCLPFSMQSSGTLPWSIDVSLNRQSLNPPVRPVPAQKPRSGPWSRSPLQAVTVSHLVSDACPSQCKALTICHVNRHLSGSPESRLTCETRLPRSPGLACGAARSPCKHSHSASPCVRCLSFSMLKALIARHACMHPYDKLESKPTCETGLAQKPRSGLWSPLAPCKHSRCLTLCHMPAIFNAKLWHPCHVNRRLSGSPESSTHL